MRQCGTPHLEKPLLTSNGGIETLLLPSSFQYKIYDKERYTSEESSCAKVILQYGIFFRFQLCDLNL